MIYKKLLFAVHSFLAAYAGGLSRLAIAARHACDQFDKLPIWCDYIIVHVDLSQALYILCPSAQLRLNWDRFQDALENICVREISWKTAPILICHLLHSENSGYGGDGGDLWGSIGEKFATLVHLYAKILRSLPRWPLFFHCLICYVWFTAN